MVEARTKWINTVRGLLRSFGYKVSGKAPHTFVDRVDQDGTALGPQSCD